MNIDDLNCYPDNSDTTSTGNKIYHSAICSSPLGQELDESFGIQTSTIDNNHPPPPGAQPIHDNLHEVEGDINLFDSNASDGEKGREKAPDLNEQLKVFRQQWQDELQNPSDQNPRVQMQPSTESDDVEERAKAYYFQGIQMEESHNLMEAIYYYKKALHLVPDIESKLAPLFAQSPRDRVRQDSESSYEGSEIEEDLITHFENICVDDKALCHPVYEQRMTHISALPVELVMYILQWVVSSMLDFRSMENISQVCRGFFLCARDEQIWKMACDKLWGVNVGSAKKYGSSWRRMLIERPHPLFDGCYISRMTYMRQGEQTLYQFYRPCHIVQYYRYVRFFPDGSAMMLVSSEDPMQSLPKLKYKTSRAAGLLIGGYRLMDNRITCVMKRVKSEQPSTFRYKRQRRAAHNETSISYYADFELSSSGKRHNAKLTWVKYTSCTFNKSTGEEIMSNFELSRASFPSLIFSHVTSFSSMSVEPLI